ncbi:alpha/beta hydrolase [Alteromonas ponticola]|uniref:Alpha/beta hydrolase n=1 Tax=Alteromonas ponticola TaxID=2720613 RepID=A0ABX1QZV0_9ALTE|nr:alpha/beta hydrolase-fold protein [Alteromonas ponticola]NMH59334.1 alpha/beta hydrolase [Alteromonas ponticola]
MTLLIGLMMSTALLASETGLQLIVQPPASYSSKDTIHIVGNFNDWQLDGDEAEQLQWVEGRLQADLNVEQGELFFTFVKNKSWRNMPASLDGRSLCTFHRSIADSTSQIQVSLPAWNTDSPIKERSSTVTGTVKYLRQIYNPQFERFDDIAVYLPQSYSPQSDKRYPVLYMLDGQNLFDTATSYSDEWQIDERLAKLESEQDLEMIVVAVPNSEQRWTEYNPWPFLNSEGKQVEGKGAATIAFIQHTLKPVIDSKFNTLQSQTGLAGSSLGGLMALYAGIEHGKVFSFVAAFSPALDIHNKDGENVLFAALKNKQLSASKIYFDMGWVEYGDYARVNQLAQLLETAYGKQQHKLKLVKDDLGRHCELDWSKRFPDAIEWLIASDSN